MNDQFSYNSDDEVAMLEKENEVRKEEM